MNLDDEMCKQLIQQKKFLCFHTLDEPAMEIPWPEDCNDCKEIKGVEYLGSTTLREPCSDCQYNGTWVWDESTKAWVTAA